MKIIRVLIETIKLKLKERRLKKKEAFLNKTRFYIANEEKLMNNLEKKLLTINEQYDLSRENYLRLQCIHSGTILKPLLKNDKFVLTNSRELIHEFPELSKIKALSLENTFNYESAKKELKCLKKALKKYDFKLNYQIIPVISFASIYKIVIDFKLNKNLCRQITIHKLTNDW